MLVDGYNLKHPRQQNAGNQSFRAALAGQDAAWMFRVKLYDALQGRSRRGVAYGNKHGITGHYLLAAVLFGVLLVNRSPAKHGEKILEGHI